jgi:hypothetical protein
MYVHYMLENIGTWLTGYTKNAQNDPLARKTTRFSGQGNDNF